MNDSPTALHSLIIFHPFFVLHFSDKEGGGRGEGGDRFSSSKCTIVAEKRGRGLTDRRRRQRFAACKVARAHCSQCVDKNVEHVAGGPSSPIRVNQQDTRIEQSS